jgi:hypothetical protein
MPTQFLTPRFCRRIDLTLEVRLRIASIALLFSKHGTITKLAGKYNVSRPFIYEMRETLLVHGQGHFGFSPQEPIQDERLNSLKWILSLRMEGKSPIEGISSVLKRFDLPYNSVGLISQELQRIGDLQGNLLGAPVGGLRVAFCCDEVFAISLAILHIELSENRKGETWAAHWSRLLSSGYSPVCLCNDEGLGMASGQGTVLPGTPRQSDTFHGVAHRLGAWVERLEKRALKHIGEEYECLRLLGNAKTEPTRIKRQENHQKAGQRAQASIALSDAFVFLYHCLLEAFHIFDGQGNLKDSATAMADFDTALALMKSLGQQDINKEVKTIESSKVDLFQFMSVAQGVVQQLAGQVPPGVLKTLCLAWQTHKNAIKAKQTVRKNALQRKEAHLLQQLGLAPQNGTLATDNGMLALKTVVYTELDKIIQSSAAVECINSILRPYLNASKNQVTQSALNLFMAYHNHRRFKAGERKGKTPCEILTGEVQNKDWLELMLEKAA